MVAGATELGLEITKKYKKFPTLISVEAVPELKEIKSTEADWHIGAAVTLTQCEEALGGEYPALASMLRVFGSRQIRNRATMGGNIVTASPIGDSAPVLLAWMRRWSSPRCKASERFPWKFFVAYRKTALLPGEVFKAIIVPRGASQRDFSRKCEWYKVSKRREMDISTVAGCFTVDLDQRGLCAMRGWLTAESQRCPPARAKRRQLCSGRTWNAELVASVLPVLRQEFTPISDVRGEAPLPPATDYKFAGKVLFRNNHRREGRSGSARAQLAQDPLRIVPRRTKAPTNT